MKLLFGILCTICLYGTVNLVHTNLKIVTIETAPFVYKQKDSDEFSGFLIDILTELKKHVQFDYDIYTVPDGKFGQLQSNGQWNGLIGQLLTKQANLILAPLTVTSRRASVIDFTLPYMEAGITMIFKRPESGSRIPFSSFLEMVSVDDLTYQTLKSGSTYEFFQGSNYKLYKEMGDVIRESYHDLPASMDEGIKNVKEKGSVFIGESALLDYYLGHECELMTIGSEINSVGYGMAFEKGSSLTSLFSHHILRLKEAGVLDKLQAKWWTRKCRLPKLCVCSEGVSSELEETEGDEGPEGEANTHEQEQANAAQGDEALTDSNDDTTPSKSTRLLSSTFLPLIVISVGVFFNS